MSYTKGRQFSAFPKKLLQLREKVTEAAQIQIEDVRQKIEKLALLTKLQENRNGSNKDK